MKFSSLKKKAATSALAALVTMALGSGSVFAAADMPTGGEITTGSVTIGDNTFVNTGTSAIGALTNGATLMVNGNSIINWQDFSIGKGNILTINTASGALLNRVIGDNVSELYGTLNQVGCNPLLLVNPNGILVGAGATINASDLVLSTLAINDGEFLGAAGDPNFANGSNKIHFNQHFSFEPGDERTGIKFEKGAVVNFQKPVDNLGKKTGDDGMFWVYGGSIEVADGVTFAVDTSELGKGQDGTYIAPDVEFIAADHIEHGVERTDRPHIMMEGYEGNILNFGGKLSGADKIHMLG